MVRRRHTGKSIAKLRQGLRGLDRHLGRLDLLERRLLRFPVHLALRPAALLEALSAEFAAELEAKRGCFDSDPHWWMPMTLRLDAYVTMMGQKGTSSKDATAHFNRIEKLLAGFDLGGAHLLGPVDVGGDAYWWDYGQLKLYLRNAVRLVEDGKEADAMREFLSVKRGDKGLCGEAFGIDAYSTASSCRIAEGAAKRSVLASVDAIRVEAEGAVLVNVTASSIRAGEGAIAYNVVEAGELVLKPGEVCTDVFAEDGSKLRQRSTLETDGGTKWKVRQSGNTKTMGRATRLQLRLQPSCARRRRCRRPRPRPPRCALRR